MKKKTTRQKKQKPIKYKVKNAAVIVDLETLSIDSLFDAIHSPPQPKKGRRKRSTVVRHVDEEDDIKKDLLKRIKQIYKDNEFHVWSVSDLNVRTKAQLRAHFNQLQWGLSWIVKKGIVPDPPDEYPINGFRCIASSKKVWTNEYYCTMRRQYPSLYPDCGLCKREFNNAERV